MLDLSLVHALAVLAVVLMAVPPAAAGTARERALARVAARSAASDSFESSALLALPAPTGANDEVPLTANSGQSLEETGGVMPLGIGVRLQDGVCQTLLKRGTALPARAVQLLTTTQDNQRGANIDFYVGDRPLCGGNRALGGFQLDPLPSHSYRSFVQLEVVVEVSSNGYVICKGVEIESRTLGDVFAEGFWQGPLLNPSDSRIDEATDDSREVTLFSHALAKHLPVLLATRMVRLPCGRDIIIRQHQKRAEERVGTGGVLWESAIVLADYVSRNAAEFNWRGKRVLELGCGTGLVAIALAIEGANVCATDGNPKVIAGARINAEGSGPLSGTFDTDIFDWNSDVDLLRMQDKGPWDVILGSDLVYPGNAGRKCVESNQQNHPADQMLLDLLTQIAGPKTQVVFALKDRTGEVERFTQLVTGGSSEWEAVRAPPESIIPEFRHMPAIVVLHLHRRKLAEVA